MALTRKSESGFTLLEVLVALAVIAIPLVAIIGNITANVSNAAYLRDRTLAHWVAMNEVAQQQVDNEWPDPGEKKDEALMAGKTWYVKLKVKATDDPNVRRLDVEVRAEKDDGNPLDTMVAYVGHP